MSDAEKEKLSSDYVIELVRKKELSDYRKKQIEFVHRINSEARQRNHNKARSINRSAIENMISKAATELVDQASIKYQEIATCVIQSGIAEALKGAQQIKSILFANDDDDDDDDDDEDEDEADEEDEVESLEAVRSSDHDEFVESQSIALNPSLNVRLAGTPEFQLPNDIKMLLREAQEFADQGYLGPRFPKRGSDIRSINTSTTCILEKHDKIVVVPSGHNPSLLASMLKDDKVGTSRTGINPPGRGRQHNCVILNNNNYMATSTCGADGHRDGAGSTASGSSINKTDIGRNINGSGTQTIGEVKVQSMVYGNGQVSICFH